jgi:hypothetical protein
MDHKAVGLVHNALVPQSPIAVLDFVSNSQPDEGK